MMAFYKKAKNGKVKRKLTSGKASKINDSIWHR